MPSRVTDEIIGRIWRKYDSMEARLTAPLTARILDLADLRSGMRVLDLATGRGEPAIAAAHRVGPSGRVLGIDTSESSLAMARERALREGLTNLELRAVDAAFFEPPEREAFDAVLARWGLMYMKDPVAALVRAGRCLRPGRLLVAAVLVEPERTQYFTWPRRLLEKHARLPPVLNVEAPGPFRYAELESLSRDLHRAGFEVHHAEEMDVAVAELGSVPELIEWFRAFGLGGLLDALPEELQRSWAEDVAAAAEELRVGDAYRLGAVTRVVVARSR